MNHPYWKVGGRKYYNRYIAERAKLPGEEITFHLFEEAFDKLDWTQEPKETLFEIAALRAQQLRDKYRYLRLWYSGGSDSHTVLLTFLKNNIFIDEIIVYRRSPSDQFELLTPANAEQNKAAIPFLKQIQPQIPNTKITIADFGNSAYQRYFNDPECFERLGGTEFCLDYQMMYGSKPDLLLNSDYCDIKGIDKPRMIMEDGKYFSLQYDGLYQIQDPWYGDIPLEFFFITPDYPELHLKQCHLAKNWIKSKHPESTDLNELFRGDGKYILELYNCCRYPLWESTSALGWGKGATIFNKKVSSRIQQSKEYAPEFWRNYKEALSIEQKNKADLYNQDKVSHFLKGLASKKYYMGS